MLLQVVAIIFLIQASNLIIIMITFLTQSELNISAQIVVVWYILKNTSNLIPTEITMDYAIIAVQVPVVLVDQAVQVVQPVVLFWMYSFLF